MPKQPKAAESENFEQSLKELEQIVTKMDNGELSLEDALKLFERGVVLSRECQHILKNAEQKVQLLIENDGALVEESFAADDK